MTLSETKVLLFTEAIQRSNVAIRKGASVEIVNGKLVYFLNTKYKMRTNYREVLCMLQREDIQKIMAL